jgi:hypothetical protein
VKNSFFLEADTIECSHRVSTVIVVIGLLRIVIDL